MAGPLGAADSSWWSSLPAATGMIPNVSLRASDSGPSQISVHRNRYPKKRACRKQSPVSARLDFIALVPPAHQRRVAEDAESEVSVGLEPQDTILFLVTAALPLLGRVIVVAVGFVVGWVWLHRSGGLAGPSRPRSALERFDVWYARGAIDSAEYERRWRRLAGGGGS